MKPKGIMRGGKQVFPITLFFDKDVADLLTAMKEKSGKSKLRIVQDAIRKAVRI